jgi:DNA-binding MltR family transcriptional regulator
MAKKPKEPISLSSLRQATATFTKQTDRGSALLAAAWIDDALEVCLKAVFRPDKEIADKVLQAEGPLGSFSSCIKIAYLLGIIPSSLLSDLEVIRGIRNDFAHMRQVVRFTDQSMKDRCKSLTGAKAFQNGTGITIRSPRQMFLISAYLAADYLLSYMESAKPPSFPELDLYGTVIRRRAKSISLAQIEAALEQFDNSRDG